MFKLLLKKARNGELNLKELKMYYYTALTSEQYNEVRKAIEEYILASAYSSGNDNLT